MATDEYKVVEDFDNDRVVAMVEDNIIGEVDFHPTDNGRAILVSHTGVRPEYEGRGIAAAMTKVVLQYVREKGLRVIPVCRYTKVYIDTHSEYQDLL